MTGQLLAEHRGVDKISFTGSPETGHKVAVAAVDGFRRTTLELGGKSPQLIFADADLDAAAEGVAIGIFANQGQVCAAGSRIFVGRELGWPGIEANTEANTEEKTVTVVL